MTNLITAEQCAELIVSDLVAWSGPYCDVVVEPARGCRFVARKGDGSAVSALPLQKELKRRLQEAIAKTLAEFSA